MVLGGGWRVELGRYSKGWHLGETTLVITTYLRRFRALLFIALLGPVAAEADNRVSLEQLMSAFGWDFSKATIRPQKVAENLYVLFGLGGNIAVSVGPQGTLLVDNQFPQLMPKIKETLAEIGGGAVTFAINTHWHFDHAEGNLALGPEGTWLVAHANARTMMQGDHIVNLVGFQYEQKAYPEAARPVITYDDVMHLHFNGQRLDLMHFGAAHTTGDSAVFFRGSNAVHMGDVFNNAGYPFIDADSGGSLDGIIGFCKAVLARIDSSTIVIPGHGPVTNVQVLRDYVAMLSSVRATIAELIAEGAALEAVIAARPTARFDKRYGDPAMFVDRAYVSLVRDLADGSGP